MANKDPMCKTRPPRKYFFFKVTRNQEAVKNLYSCKTLCLSRFHMNKVRRLAHFKLKQINQEPFLFMTSV